jgi:MOSC domain-containing protein YiiM
MALFIGPDPEGPMESRNDVVAVAGLGLRGDRYFQHDAAPENRESSLEVTLIAAEDVTEAAERSGIDIRPEDTRRNVVTSGVRLDDLLGSTFWVGEVELEGLERNPPCSHLERVSGKKLLKPLIDGGGIRARILKSGTIRTGDAIRHR